MISLLLLLLAACAQQQATPTVFCAPPYIEWSPSQCCLDLDNNAIYSISSKLTGGINEVLNQKNTFIQKKDSDEKRLVISYTGMVYEGRQDPSPFFAALKVLINTITHTAKAERLPISSIG